MNNLEQINEKMETIEGLLESLYLLHDIFVYCGMFLIAFLSIKFWLLRSKHKALLTEFGVLKLKTIAAHENGWKNSSTTERERVAINTLITQIKEYEKKLNLDNSNKHLLYWDEDLLEMLYWDVANLEWKKCEDS